MPLGDQIDVLLEDHGTLSSEDIIKSIKETTGENHEGTIPQILIQDARFVETGEDRWELNVI